MTNIFKKGLILGGILSVAAVAGFLATKKGQELTEDLKNELKPLTKSLKKHLGEVKDITKDKFYEMTESIVKEYGKQKGLTTAAIASLTTTLQDTWSEMEQVYKEDTNADAEKTTKVKKTKSA